MEKAPQHPPNSRPCALESASRDTNGEKVIQFPNAAARRGERRRRERRTIDVELREFTDRWPTIKAFIADYDKLKADFEHLRGQSHFVHSNCVLAKSILRGGD